MLDASSYAIRIAVWLAHAIGDSAPALELCLRGSLGLELPAAVIEAQAVADALTAAGTAAAQVGKARDSVNDAAERGDDEAVLLGLVNLGKALSAFYPALTDVEAAVKGNITEATVPSESARTAAVSFAGTIAERIGEYTLASAITDLTPRFAFVLRVLGLLDWRRVPAVDGVELSRDYVVKRLQLRGVTGLISNPPTVFGPVGWGTDEFDPEDVFRLARDFFHPEADVEVGLASGDPFLRIGAFRVARDPSVSPPGLVLDLIARFADDRSGRVALNERWGVGLRSDLRLEGNVSAQVTPRLVIALKPGSGGVSGGLQVTIDRNEEARPFSLLEGTGLLAVRATNVALVLDMATEWDTAASVARIDPLVSVVLDGAVVDLQTDKADSFVGSLLHGQALQAQFDLGLEWRAKSGLRVTGSGGLEAVLPVHQALGAVALQSIYVALHIGGDGDLSLEASAELSAVLGPVTASVKRLGASLDLRLSDKTDARFGVFNVGLGFKPPDGVGLEIDAGPVTGQGALLVGPYDSYAGWGTLSFSELTLHALALLASRLPDGSPLPAPGWSLLAVITASDLNIQLGLGFKLDGVGGLFGVHRAASVPALRDAVRTGTLGSVLFPSEDEDALPLEALSAVDRLFPVTPERYVFGPMVEIGWGPGVVTFVRAELALLFELPAPVRLILLGRLSMSLPTEDEALVSIHMDALGVIDFGMEEASLDASLYDSSIVGMALTGDMAMRLRWGARPVFALAIGGFHPKFSPPENFPMLRRLAISIADSEKLRIRLEGYLALTSATVQFGARLQLDAHVGSLSISGGAYFDALFRFLPTFGVLIDMGGFISVWWDSTELLGVSIDLTLSGTTPWDAEGVFHVTILFVSVSKRFHDTWGRSELPPAPEAVDAGERLVKALDDARTWSAQAPTGAEGLVSLRAQPGASETTLLAHPLGSISFLQHVVPLNTPITHFGNAPLLEGSGNRFEVSATINETAPPVALLEAQFAEADFVDLTDDERLTRGAFTGYPAGLRIGDDPDEVPHSDDVEAYGNQLPPLMLGYEVQYAPPSPTRSAAGKVPLWSDELEALLPLGAAARAPIRTTGAASYRSSAVPRLVARLPTTTYSAVIDGRPVEGTLLEVLSASRQRGVGQRTRVATNQQSVLA